MDYYMLIRILSYFTFASLTFQALAQQNNPGTPFIINHSRQAYQAATQNWDIDQSPSGIMYFANNEGLLSYDGTRWLCRPLPNRTIARSIAIDSRGNIYVGGQDEFGIFRPDVKGDLVFQSLKNRIPEAFRSFEDVWDIVLNDESVIFRTNYRLYHIQPDTVTVFQAKSTFRSLFAAGNHILVQDIEGLYQLKNQQLVYLPGTQMLSDKTVKGILPFGVDSLLILTLKEGIFLLHNQVLSLWENQTLNFIGSGRMHGAVILPDQRIAIGTSQNGLILLDVKGKPLYQIDKRNGLQNNNVLSLFPDRLGNLWLGLNNGIDFIETGSPFSAIYPDGNLKDAGYSVSIHEGYIYFGTNNGLYSAPWQPYYDPFQPGRYSRVENTSGQVWGTVSIGEKLLMGHHEGAFTIETNRAVPLLPPGGAWTFLLLNKFPGYMIGGTYNGINLYESRNGKWEYLKKLNGLDESCRIMAQDNDGTIWIAHPYRGIYRLTFPDRPDTMTVKFYQSEDGLPDDNFNHVFRVRNEVMFATAKGVYNYNRETGRFEPNQPFAKILGENWVRLLREDRDGNVWFVVNNEVGLLKVEQKGVETLLSRRDFPELRDKLVKGHEFLYPYDQQNVFFAGESGFIHYNPQRSTLHDSSLRVLLQSCHLLREKDSLVFGGIFAVDGVPVNQQPEEQKPIFAYNENAFRFTFATPEFLEAGGIEYRFYLSRLEKEWGIWTNKTEKEYTNLSPGVYQFFLQSKNKHGILSEVVSYSFTISPPWYASHTAKGLYFFIALLMILSLLLIPRIRFKRETQKLQGILKKQEAEQEEQISRINNERLEEEVRHQNRELASATMHLVQKNDILFKIRGELESIASITRDESARKKINDLLGLIHYDRQIDQDWEQFAFYFDQVHRDFLKRLGEQFPQLSPADHRLCAYLRMNLSSKEIAPLLNISVRGVETGRYRLRKKMDLGHDINLNEFMMKF
ncbi:MAG: two-component regulator propeller domain-containing protein [Bacteroidia bacterium]|nr:two-component regulator propeller domain-containing protein [Bacteroidia bacterium]